LSDSDSTIPMKICIKCGEKKPATSEFFHARPLGFRAECKECRNNYQRAAWAKRRQKWLAEHPRDDSVKTCTKCGEEKPATTEFFHRNGGRLYAWCKQCHNASRRLYGYSELTGEKRALRLEYLRQWRVEHVEERRRAKAKWRVDNLEAKRAHDRGVGHPKYRYLAIIPQTISNNNISVNMVNAFIVVPRWMINITSTM